MAAGGTAVPAGEQPTRLTLAELLDRAAAADAGRVLLRHEDRRIACGELRDASARIAAGLAALGVQRGDAVVLLTRDAFGMARLWFAAARLGAFLMPLNAEQTAEGLASLVRGLVPRVIAIDAELAQHRAVLAAEAPDAILLDLQELPEREGADLPIAAHWSDPALVMGSSGSTGVPKRILLSHRYVIHIAQEQTRARRVSPGDVLYSPLPIFHLAAPTSTLVSPLLCGASGAFDRKFSAHAFWDRCRAYGARHVTLIGSMIPRLHALPPRGDDRDHPVRTISTTPSHPGIVSAMKARFGVEFLFAFGLTEATPMIGLDPESELPPGASGRANPWFEVQLHDEHGEPVADGAVGELVCRPRVRGVMFDGYLGYPAATAQAQRGLWFHSGDLGRRIGGEFYEFVGRAADRLRRGGENISAHELEATLLTMPGVSEVAAHNVGPVGQEEIRVVVVPVAGTAREPRAFAASFAAFAAQRLPKFARPRYLELAESLPRAASDHLRRAELIAQGVSPTAIDLNAL
jgi:crotonobetaine/carnitine-CoA ligase